MVRAAAPPGLLEEDPRRHSREGGDLPRQVGLVGVARPLHQACETDMALIGSLGECEEPLEAQDALERLGTEAERGDEAPMKLAGVRCKGPTPRRRGRRTAMAVSRPIAIRAQLVRDLDGSVRGRAVLVRAPFGADLQHPDARDLARDLGRGHALPIALDRIPFKSHHVSETFNRPEACPGSVADMHAEAIPGRRSTLLLLAAATAVGAMGLAAGGSAGALLAEDITGSTTWAGVPLGVLVLGSAAGALLISRHARHAGRGAGLVLGYGIGAAGAVMVVAAAAIDDLALLLAGSAALGTANAAIFLTRYAGADLGGDSGRGRALGVVFFATALGAVASPNLLGPSGDLAEGLGLARLSGLYLVAFVAFGAAGTLLAALPRRALPVGSEPVSRR